MRYLLPLFLFLLPLFVSAQELPKDETGKITFTEVVELSNTTKADLYTRARKWYAVSFNSADAVLEMDDKESGTLIGKAYQDIFIGIAGIKSRQKMWYSVQVYLKDNKYKYEITDISFQGYPDANNPGANQKVTAEKMFSKEVALNRKGEMKPVVKSYYDASQKAINSLTTDLKTAMAKGASKDF